MSTPIPGDVLPLWNPDIPGEEIATGRLGIRIRPGTPAAVRRYEASEQWIECPKCETEVPTSNGIHCPSCGEDMRGGEYVRAILHLVDDADGRIYRGIDSLTVRSAGFPEYRGMSLDRI